MVDAILQAPEAFGARLQRWARIVMSIRGDRDGHDIPLDDVDRTTKLIAREAAKAAIEIQTYNEGGGKGVQSWKDWILGIVALLLAAGIGAVLIQLSDLRERTGRIESKQDTSIIATNQRLEADERRIENLERRVFR